MVVVIDGKILNLCPFEAQPTWLGVIINQANLWIHSSGGGKNWGGEMMHELLDPVSFGPKMKSWPSCSCSSFYGGYILRLEITPPHSLAFWLYKSALWQIIYVSTRTRLYMFPLFFTRLCNPIDFNNYICFHMSNTLCFTRLYMFPLFFWQIFDYNWYSKLLRQAVVRKIYHPSLPVWSWLYCYHQFFLIAEIEILYCYHLFR